jgi:predicted RNA-binding Zn ribbon-like protein
MKRQEAPGQLETVRLFVNSLDLEAHTDAFATVEGLRGWLTANLPAARIRALTEADRLVMVRFREALRSAATANGRPAPSEPDWLAALNEAAAACPIRLRFGDNVMPEPAAPDEGLEAVFAHLLWTVAVAAIDGTWNRLKACPAQDCRWAFYDHAKNSMGVWCQMAECGNKRKARAYRSRQRSFR